MSTILTKSSDTSKEESQASSSSAVKVTREDNDKIIVKKLEGGQVTETIIYVITAEDTDFFNQLKIKLRKLELNI